MKKINYLSAALILLGGVANANPVMPQTARTVAHNFYMQNNSSATSPVCNLLYIATSADGQPDYYVFDASPNKGFIIVSAEDAAHPILGYSNKGNYQLSSPENPNLTWWMNCRKQEIEYARKQSMVADADIAGEWNAYQNNTVVKRHNAMTTYGPLLTVTWNQFGPYNNMCPGGSVTGCVATAMAQIMSYWQYPSHGHGSSGYWDMKAYTYQNNFGYLKANYDTSNYNWPAMIANSNDPDVAKLMYDCGVSVDMDYSPSESGAWVITGDYPVCSQVSYVKYFGYNPYTIQGLYQAKYSNVNWTNLIINELANSRPVQYVGFDSIQNAGHTWVCDGYNSTTGLFDMNWGWGGSNDGPFALNALNAGGYHFNWWNEALIGIEPPYTSPYFTATPTFGCTGLSVQFTDWSVANAPITNIKWLFPGGSPNNYTGATPPAIVYNTAGTYDVSEIVTDANGTDTLTRKAYIGVASQGTLPLSQGFQSPTFPPTGWVINNPNNYSYVWQLNTTVGGYGNSTQSMEFNNCQGYQDWAPPGKAGLDIIGQRQQIYTPEYDFTSIPNPKMYFDVAYAPYNSTYSDTLAIYYSLDCGKTFTQVYLKSGLTLGTAGKYVTTGADTNSQGCFTPLNNNWRTDTIHIPAISGKTGVIFSFENRSGNGSPLYIDNINIGGLPTAVPSLSANPSVKVYPNPNTGEFTINLTNVSGNPFVKIYNVLGEQVYLSQLKNQNTQINLGAQSKGVYIYRIFSENGSSISTGRLVIE